MSHFTFYKPIDPFTPYGEMTFTLQPLKIPFKIPEQIPETKPVSPEWFNSDVYTPSNETTNNKHATTVISKNPSRQEWVGAMIQSYQKALGKLKIDKSYTKLLVAQDALESGWGKSVSGKYNYGGIKGKGTTTNTKEFVNGKMINTKGEFRDFDNIDEYTTYKVNLLNNERFHAFDGNDFFENLVKGGYATDPKYAQKLRAISLKIT